MIEFPIAAIGDHEMRLFEFHTARAEMAATSVESRVVVQYSLCKDDGSIESAGSPSFNRVPPVRGAMVELHVEDGVSCTFAV